MENKNINQEVEMQPTEQVIEEPSVTQEQGKQPKKFVGYWEFLGLIALFAIPVIGFIACIVFMFTPKRKCMKNYARAVFTWMVIRLVTAILAISLALTALGNLLLPTINSQFGTNFTSINEVFSIVGNVVTEDYSAVIKTLQPQLTETLGEESKPILEELSKKEYNKLLSQVVDEDYDEMLKDFEKGKYKNLANVMGEEGYNNFIAELKTAASGEPSEFFDGIKSIIPSF